MLMTKIGRFFVNLFFKVVQMMLMNIVITKFVIEYASQSS